MMSVVEALAQAAAHGVSFWLKDGRVRCRHGEALPPDLFEALYAKIDELREVLAGNRCRHCGRPIDWTQPGGLVFADGTGAHLACYERVETERQAAPSAGTAAQARRQPKERAA
jgi:hypothetical protein